MVRCFNGSRIRRCSSNSPSNHLPSSLSTTLKRKYTTQLKVVLKAAQVPLVDELAMILPTEILSSYVAAWREFPTNFSDIWDNVPIVFTRIWTEVPVKMALVWRKVPALLDFAWKKLPPWFTEKWDKAPSKFAQTWNKFPAVFSAVWSGQDSTLNRGVFKKCPMKLGVLRTIGFGF